VFLSITINRKYSNSRKFYTKLRKRFEDVINRDEITSNKLKEAT